MAATERGVDGVSGNRKRYKSMSTITRAPHNTSSSFTAFREDRSDGYFCRACVRARGLLGFFCVYVDE